MKNHKAKDAFAIVTAAPTITAIAGMMMMLYFRQLDVLRISGPDKVVYRGGEPTTAAPAPLLERIAEWLRISPSR